MTGEFIVRPGSTNSNLYLLMAGSAFKNRRSASAGLSRRGGLDGFDRAQYLSAKAFAVVGDDIINTLVGAPAVCAYSVSAIGHASCSVLTARAFARIATTQLCPRILCQLRHVAGWNVFKAGVLRLGRLAMHEREARLAYYVAALAIQREFWARRGVLGREYRRRLADARDERRPAPLGLAYRRLPTRNRHCPVAFLTPRHGSAAGPWAAGDAVEARIGAGDAYRPARVVRAHARSHTRAASARRGPSRENPESSGRGRTARSGTRYRSTPSSGR